VSLRTKQLSAPQSSELPAFFARSLPGETTIGFPFLLFFCCLLYLALHFRLLFIHGNDFVPLLMPFSMSAPHARAAPSLRHGARLPSTTPSSSSLARLRPLRSRPRPQPKLRPPLAPASHARTRLPFSLRLRLRVLCILDASNLLVAGIFYLHRRDLLRARQPRQLFVKYPARLLSSWRDAQAQPLCSLLRGAHQRSRFSFVRFTSSLLTS
jgi:hypothetical protein